MSRDRTTNEKHIQRLAGPALDALHGGSYGPGPERDRQDRTRGLVAILKQRPLDVATVSDQELARWCHEEIAVELRRQVDMGLVDLDLGALFNALWSFLDDIGALYRKEASAQRS
jgi:hypothetical protein